MEQVAEQRAKARSNLSDGAFPSSRSTAAEGQRTGNDLHQGYTGADLPLVIMVRRDDGIGAVSFCFGCERVDKHAAQQSPDCRYYQQEPRIKRDVRSPAAMTSKVRRPDEAAGNNLQQRPVRNVPQLGSQRRTQWHRALPRYPPRPLTPRVGLGNESVLDPGSGLREPKRKSSPKEKTDA